MSCLLTILAISVITVLDPCGNNSNHLRLEPLLSFLKYVLNVLGLEYIPGLSNVIVGDDDRLIEFECSTASKPTMGGELPSTISNGNWVGLPVMSCRVRYHVPITSFGFEHSCHQPCKYVSLAGFKSTCIPSASHIIAIFTSPAVLVGAPLSMIGLKPLFPAHGSKISISELVPFAYE